MRSIKFVMLCSILLGGCTATARPVFPPAPPGIHIQTLATRTLVHDTPYRLNFLTSLNADCSSFGATVVQVIDAPANGRTEVVRTQDYPSYLPGNQRAECNKKKTAGTKVTYDPNPRFTGIDHLTLDAIYPTGQAQRIRYNLVVI